MLQLLISILKKTTKIRNLLGVEDPRQNKNAYFTNKNIYKLNFLYILVEKNKNKNRNKNKNVLIYVLKHNI